MALRLGVDMKLFDVVAKKSDRDEINIEQLSEATGADSLLISKCYGIRLSVKGIHEVNHRQLAL